MAIIIRAERPDSVDARHLIDELETLLEPLYPAASRHGYAVERLLREGVTFFVVYQDGAAAGCGGILLVGTEYGELKRMYIRSAYRGQGLGVALLDHLAAYAREHGVPLLRLETGIYQTEAIRLYERYGFTRIVPFGPYFEDPVSLCYEKQID